MRHFLSVFVTLLAAEGALAEAAKPLKLLLLTADDLNADSSGWMGSKLGATANLDALASTCHRFVNHHVTAPICQPSRSALMTGRVPHRNGALGFHPINTVSSGKSFPQRCIRTRSASLMFHGWATGKRGSASRR